MARHPQRTIWLDPPTDEKMGEGLKEDGTSSPANDLACAT